MRKLFKESTLKEFPVGSPEYFVVQKQLIRKRPLLKHCYDDWYARLCRDVSSVKQDGLMLELGSGGSLLDDVLPEVITSDVVEGVAERVIDARQLPFEDGSVKALLLTHVFHHIPDIRAFLHEARRVLVPGGVISMIEVAHTPLAKFIFRNFHPEPYEDAVSEWAFDQKDSMMDSNQALSWIAFVRDRATFEKEFPDFIIEPPQYTPWFSYLLSGGVSKSSLVPDALSGLVLRFEKSLTSLSPFCSLHWHLCLRKRL